MKVLVKPIYGWGWYESDNHPLPSPFSLDLEVIKSGDRPELTFGQIDEPKHLLNGKWVLLSIRNKAGNIYNLSAFHEKPSSWEVAADVSGFAEVMFDSSNVAS